MNENTNNASINRNDAIIPRPEYPRPDRSRENGLWLNLNGEWEHSADLRKSGKERELYRADAVLDEKITVPFCRESKLSGIGDTDFCAAVWYKRQVFLDEEWFACSRRVILNIGACDFRTEVFVNGSFAGVHLGGYSAFAFDITSKLKHGENIITIYAEDDTRSGRQAGGKQSPRYGSYGCFYTRTTGIWQTVWLESVPDCYIKGVKLYPDIKSGRVTAFVTFAGGSYDAVNVNAVASYNDNVVGEANVAVCAGTAIFDVYLDETHLWEVGEGNMYSLVLTAGDDVVSCTFGMREIEVRDGFMYINGKPVFERLVLDQGFYPDGVYTAPTLAELYADVDRSIAMGFNGARLHQKVFEPLFLDYCDKKGYIVWGEHGNWGLDIARSDGHMNFLEEWREIVERDFNHPSIVGWCPLNETQSNQNNDFIRALAALTRSLDSTRAYIDASGWTHVTGVTDIIDMHCYEQSPEKFAEILAPIAENKPLDLRGKFFGVPTFMSEYGGIRWAADDTAGWGYGNAPASEEEFLARFKGLTEVLLFNRKIGALCYTQLTDVEQELNGLYTYNRQAKFPPDFFREVLTQRAAIEADDADKE